MSVLRNLLVVLALLVGGVMAASWWFQPSGTLKYKLSIYVDDNGTPYHGEGVLQVTYSGQLWFPMSQGAPWDAGVSHGEAIPVDIGSKGTIFVLLPTVNPLAHFFHFYLNDFPQDRSALVAIAAFLQSRPSVDIDPAELPMLVHFRDVRDVTTIELIDPSDLRSNFGTGIRIVRVHVAITDEPVTTGILARLPWIPTLHYTLMSTLGLSYANPLSQMGPQSFKVEF